MKPVLRLLGCGLAVFLIVILAMGAINTLFSPASFALLLPGAGMLKGQAAISSLPAIIAGLTLAMMCLMSLGNFNLDKLKETDLKREKEYNFGTKTGCDIILYPDNYKIINLTNQKWLNFKGHWGAKASTIGKEYKKKKEYQSLINKPIIFGDGPLGPKMKPIYKDPGRYETIPYLKFKDGADIFFKK